MAQQGVQVRFNNGSQFQKNLGRKAGRKYNAAFHRVMQAVVDQTNANVKKAFVIDRNPERRRRGPRLYGNFYYKIDGDGNSFPMRGRLLSRASKAKVMTLDKGNSKGSYRIAPNGKGLLIPGKRIGKEGFDFGAPNWFPYGRQKRVKLKSVTHRGPRFKAPGGANFTGRAVDQVKTQIRSGKFRVR
jgi:hypothetical protein